MGPLAIFTLCMAASMSKRYWIGWAEALSLRGR